MFCWTRHRLFHGKARSHTSSPHLASLVLAVSVHDGYALWHDLYAVSKSLRLAISRATEHGLAQGGPLLLRIADLLRPGHRVPADRSGLHPCRPTMRSSPGTAQ